MHLDTSAEDTKAYASNAISSATVANNSGRDAKT